MWDKGEGAGDTLWAWARPLVQPQRKAGARLSA